MTTLQELMQFFSKLPGHSLINKLESLASTPKKIGIYGGTFDPIHHGHLILAREALETLQLEKVIFIPASVSPHKTQGQTSASSLRLEMLQAAIAGEATFGLDDLELRRPPPSFTIDTIEEIRKREVTAEIFYMIGEDNVQSLQSWHRFKELKQLVQFVVLERTALKTCHPYPTVCRNVDISGTDIRKRVATGRSIRYLVPSAVEEIIVREQLYKESTR